MTSIDDGQGFKMTQDGIIKKIFKTCSMKYCKLRPTSTAVVATPGTD